MEKKTRGLVPVNGLTGTVKYRFSVLKMAGKFNYVIESEGPKNINFCHEERGGRERLLGSRYKSPPSKPGIKCH